MKNLLIPIATFIAGLVVGAIIIFALNDDGTVTPITCPKFDYSAEPDYKHISDATARDLADRYKNECQPALSNIINQEGVVDARCIQFSLASLKKYIWELETKVCGCDTFRDLGIRFYYGKYPDLRKSRAGQYPDLAGLDPNYSSLHTIFLVPTYKDATGVNRDFEPLDITNCKVGDARQPSSVVSIMNHGNLSPPPFPEVNKSLSGLKY
ncbi:MAG TPA: hypothetical protein PLU17_12615 [Chitinophagaceae bacterium]|nr:hypothetical protein [Chitinophagaceae bacterium]